MRGKLRGLLRGFLGKYIPCGLRYNEIVELVFSDIRKRNEYW
jgi:hypothetical protein